MPKGIRIQQSLLSWLPTRKWQINTGLLLTVILAVIIVFAGGSSRADALQLLVLRPVVIVIGLMLLWQARETWPDINPLPALLGFFAATMAIQLIPLPPAVWHTIPGHARYNDVLDAFGANIVWRPLTVSVDGTINALVALTVPVAVLAAMANLHQEWRQRGLFCIFAIILTSMILGLLQTTGGSTSALYFYDTDPNDQLVGLFANRNHQAAALAMTLPLIRAWVLMPRLDRLTPGKQRLAIGIFAATAIIVYVLVVGSRAGVILAGVGVIGAFSVQPNFSDMRRWSWKRWLVAVAIVVGLCGVVALVGFADRSASIDRISDTRALSAEGRVEYLPVMLQIARDVWPFGTGYGSFVPVFKSYEQDAMLNPYYWNNAHSDPIEVLITGGALGMFGLAIFVAWWSRASYRCYRSENQSKSTMILARASVFATLILMLASLVDYPLRTPLLGSVFTVLCCWINWGERFEVNPRRLNRSS